MIIAGEASRTSTRNCAEPPAPPKSKTARSASEANVGVPAFWKQIEAAQGALPAPAPAACATAKPSDVGGADARSGVAATAAAATIPEGAAERNGGPTSARDRVDAGAPPLALSKPSVSMDIGVMLSATYGSATEPDDDEVGSPRRICVTAATSVPGLGSPLPHLHRDLGSGLGVGRAAAQRGQAEPDGPLRRATSRARAAAVQRGARQHAAASSEHLFEVRTILQRSRGLLGCSAVECSLCER